MKLKKVAVDCLVPSVTCFRNDKISSEVIESSSLSPNWLSNLDRMKSYDTAPLFGLIEFGLIP